MVAVELQDLPGLGRFRVLERLGSGSMGVVYRAVDPENDREVALKTLRVAAAEDLYRLKREFRVLVSVVHPNLVELYELFALDDRCFFTMELVRGWPCTEWVQRTGAAAAGQAHGEVVQARILAVLEQLHAGLTAVHAAGHVHRDVKPSNVLVASTGRLVLLDFGLAAALAGQEAFEASVGVVAGTVPYMAPEQLRGLTPHPAMDWYAVGIVLYEMLTGELPFAGPLHEVLLQKERRRVTVPAAHGPLGDLVAALLDPNPERRAGASAVADTLHHLGHTRQVLRPSRRAEPFCGRQREIARLRALLDAVEPEHPVVVRVHGPSGIGKTRLLAQFVHELSDRALVFRGRCHPNETLPYKGLDRIVDEISRYLVQLPDTLASALVPRHAAALMRLFPVLGRVPAFATQRSPLGSLDLQEVRRRGFAALRDLLGKMADRGPVVVWIDDLQWGDVDSARLVAELLRPPDAPGILLLLSFPEADQAAEILLAQLLGAIPGAARSAEDLSIGPLAETEARELAGLMLSGSAEAPSDVAAQIAAESEGSPLLLSELVGHLQVMRTPLGAEVPKGRRLERLTLDRIDALSSEARDMLDLVAIAGGPLERSVLASAAGGATPRALMSILGQRLFVRDTTIDQRPAVEAFHERIRATIVANMPAERQQDCHRRLGEALRQSPTAAPEALARHLHAAGDNLQAAEYAVAAGDRAAGALAFLRAAEHYAQALAWRTDDSEWSRAVRRRRADVLVNAGHCAAAAAEYLAAARTASALEQLDLQRLACKQFLAAGRHDEALAVLRPLLKGLGLPYPASGTGAAVRAALRVAVLALRPARLKPRPAQGARAARDLLRVDICDAVARGLIPVDAMRGVYFLLLGLTLAQRAGERSRYGRFLTGVGGSVLAMGPRLLRRRGKQMIALADTIASDLADHYIEGSASAARGQVALARAEWREALRLSDTAAELDQGYLGVAFERNVARMAAFRALEELGEFAEVARRGEAQRLLAIGNGDRYAEVTAQLYLAYAYLAADEPAKVEAFAEDILTRWSVHGFHIQHLYAHRCAAYAALYRGDVDGAAQRVHVIRRGLARSGLLFVPLPRFDTALLDARVTLALAARHPARRAALLRACSRTIRRIEREPRTDARGHALLLRAACRWLAGDAAQAQHLLAQSAEAFRTADMALYAACADYRRAALAGEPGGDATDWCARYAIRNPPHWLRVYAPGFCDES